MKCERCDKKIAVSNKLAREKWDRYRPFCSFNCQEWARLEGADIYAKSLR